MTDENKCPKCGASVKEKGLCDKCDRELEMKALMSQESISFKDYLKQTGHKAFKEDVSPQDVEDAKMWFKRAQARRAKALALAKKDPDFDPNTYEDDGEHAEESLKEFTPKGRNCDECGAHLSDDDFDKPGSWNYTCPKCEFRYIHGMDLNKEEGFKIGDSVSYNGAPAKITGYYANDSEYEIEFNGKYMYVKADELKESINKVEEYETKNIPEMIKDKNNGMSLEDIAKKYNTTVNVLKVRLFGTESINHVEDEWKVKDKDGHVIGTHDTKKDAEGQKAAIGIASKEDISSEIHTKMTLARDTFNKKYTELNDEQKEVIDNHYNNMNKSFGKESMSLKEWAYGLTKDKSFKEDWVCRSCGHLNTGNPKLCKDCGQPLV